MYDCNSENPQALDAWVASTFPTLKAIQIAYLKSDPGTNEEYLLERFLVLIQRAMEFGAEHSNLFTSSMQVREDDRTLQTMAAFGWKLVDELKIDGAWYTLMSFQDVTEKSGMPHLVLSAELITVSNSVDISRFLSAACGQEVTVGKDIVSNLFDLRLHLSVSGPVSVRSMWSDFEDLYNRWVYSLHMVHMNEEMVQTIAEIAESL